jgi:phosphopantothenoylcysteine decarboxylase/phosphopantothenate--cysteine ligase
MKKRALILSGPTHEYFDPVRFIGNASSGKMGRALAEEALQQGMEVDWISGPVPAENLPENALNRPDLNLLRVISAEEMLTAARGKFAAADLILFAAAVADYRPSEKQAEKIEKTGKTISIELSPTPDIAATLCAAKRADQKAIGFALQTHDGETKAREKLRAKNLDGIVLNTPATLGAETGLFTWIDATSGESWGLLSKTDCAKRIFQKLRAPAPSLLEPSFHLSRGWEKPKL